MAAKITGASLQPILQRLNNAPSYHPFEADAFSDWSTEAGDIITVSRGSDTYTSPANVTRMVWKGNAPTVKISSTGNKEREPIAKVSRKKYGRGSAGIRSQEGIFRNFTSEDGILHSSLAITESYLRTEFHNESDSLRSYFDMTSSHLRTEFIDEVHSLRGDFEVTVSHMRTEFTDEVSSLHGEFEVTVSHLRTEFTDEVNSVRGEFEVTATHLRNEFVDEMTSMRSEFEITATHLRNEFIDGANSLRSEFEITATHLRNEFIDEVNSVRSYTEQTASSWETRVEGVVDANGNVTAASIALAVNNAGSSVKINANKIYLLGQTIADTIDADYISSAIAEIPHLYTNHITMDGDLTLGGRLWLLGVNVTSLVSGVKSVRISDPVNNTYKLQYTTYDDDSWQDAGSFSRATTLTGSWGGTVAAGKSFTVTASPQGNIKAGKVYGEIVPDTSDPVDYTVDGNNHYVARDYIIYSEDENGDADVQILKKEVKISADLAYSDGYTTGYEEGSASGGSTTLTNTWNNGHLVVTASPQGEVLERWLSSGTPTFSGTLVSIPVNALFGNSQQYSESTGWSASANISSLLQSKTVTSNGTVTPGSGYIGLSSVTVNVPTTNARAHFGATSGQYYIEAVDTVSGNPIPNSSVSYSLVASGSNVTISAGSGQTVPSIALGINSGSLSNGSRTLTVTAGGSNTTATVTITDYSAGWTAAYGKVSLPANNTSTGFMVVETPPSTVGGNAISTTYTLDTANNNIAYIKQGSSVKAQVTHNKYNSGWTAAYNKVTLPANGTGTTMVVKTPPSTVDGNAASTTYTLSSDNNVAYVKVGNDVKAQLTHNKYSNGYTAGWHAYYNTMHFPSSGTTSTMSVYWPGYTPDSSWDSVQRDYVLSSDNNTCYLKYGSTTMAQFTHNKYTNGYNSARLSLNTSTKVISKSSSGDVTQYTLALVSDSRSTTSGSDYGKRKVWIKATPNSGSAVEVSSTTLSDYRDGWTAAYNKVSIPSSANTSTNYMTVKTPPSTVGGSADETKYYVTSDNSYTYLRKGSTAGTTVARGTNNAYGNGKNDVWNGISISYTGKATESDFEYVESNGYSSKVKIPFTTVVSSSGMTDKTDPDYWQGAPTKVWKTAFEAGYRAALSSARSYWWYGEETINDVRYWTVWTPKASAYSTITSNNTPTYTNGERWEAAKYRIPSTSHSVSITQNSNWRGYSREDVLDRMGISSFSYEWGIGGGTPYWGFKATCGGSTKYFLVYRA